MRATTGSLYLIWLMIYRDHSPNHALSGVIRILRRYDRPRSSAAVRAVAAAADGFPAASSADAARIPTPATSKRHRSSPRSLPMFYPERVTILGYDIASTANW